MIDLVIVGAGPAALSAALYAARAGLKTIAFERGEIGGELGQIAQLTNYPGFAGAGQELAAKLRQQAESAGAKIEYGECTALRLDADGARGPAASPAVSPKEALVSVASQTARDNVPGARAGQAADSGPVLVLTIDGESVPARAVLVATGSEPKTLDFVDKIQAPVSYCALCDVDLSKGQNVAVVGGANSAVHDALLLSPVATSVTLISHSELKADVALQTKLQSCSNCTIREHLEPSPELLNDFDRVFVSIGRRPATKFLENVQNGKLLDKDGYILTDENHMTVVPGVFAAGDVREGSVRQVITAAGDGVAAAISVNKWFKH